jgi:hypothetical protein
LTRFEGPPRHGENEGADQTNSGSDVANDRNVVATRKRFSSTRDQHCPTRIGAHLDLARGDSAQMHDPHHAIIDENGARLIDTG